MGIQVHGEDEPDVLEGEGDGIKDGHIDHLDVWVAMVLEVGANVGSDGPQGVDGSEHSVHQAARKQGEALSDSEADHEYK